MRAGINLSSKPKMERMRVPRRLKTIVVVVGMIILKVVEVISGKQRDRRKKKRKKRHLNRARKKKESYKILNEPLHFYFSHDFRSSFFFSKDLALPPGKQKG